MCGIVGLFLKDAKLEPRLGHLVAPMLAAMSDRGPDSAGLAVFGKPVDASQRKLSLYAGFTEEGARFAWQPLVEALNAVMDVTARVDSKGNHAVLTVQGDVEGVKTWLREHYPKLYLLSSGRSIGSVRSISRWPRPCRSRAARRWPRRPEPWSLEPRFQTARGGRSR